VGEVTFGRLAHGFRFGDAVSVGLWIQDSCNPPNSRPPAVRADETYFVAQGAYKQIPWQINSASGKRALRRKVPFFAYLRYADAGEGYLGRRSEFSWYSCIELEPVADAKTPNTRWKTMSLRAALREKADTSG